MRDAWVAVARLSGGADGMSVPDENRDDPRGETGHDAAGSDAGVDGAPGRGARLLASLVALALLAGAGGAWWWLSRQGAEAGMAAPQPPVVRVARVEAAEEVTIAQTGFARPLREVAVTPEIAARIAELGAGFETGARLARGDLLVALERDRLEADRAEAEARIAAARAALAETRVARARQEELAEEDFASEARLQDAQQAEARAEADLAAAQAARRRAELRLGDARITAPFDALVVAQDAAPGQAVSAGTVLGRLVGTTAEIRLGLAPPDIALAGGAEALRGRPVAVHATDGARLARGEVVEIDPAIAEGSRTTGLIVHVADAFSARDPRPLRVDELVELRLALTVPDRVSVPAEAVKAGGTLFRIEPGEGDGSARLARVPAQVVARVGGRALIAAEGLAAGDRVLLSDRAGALDGARVRLREGDAAGTDGRKDEGA